MPTRMRDDGTPIVTFDPLLEISPFTLFKRLQQARSPLLIDVRAEPGDLTLEGSRIERGSDWTPDDPEVEIVLFDEDGTLALAEAARLQEAGYSRVKALFGGLELYEFALDPEIVESDTFLRSGR